MAKEDIEEVVRKLTVDECKGFRATQWKGGICEKRIYPDCNEVKSDKHECDPQNKATVDFLRKDTKPWPKCGTMIFKMSGCSQMWCPECHVAFDWRTMRIETGVIHNPHFYEFKRIHGGGRNAGDIPCGGMPTLRELRELFKTTDDKQYVELEHVHRLVNHIQRYEVDRLFTGEHDYTGYRVRYMLNEMDEDSFKRQIQKDEKKLSKNHEMRDIYEMFINSTTDIMRQIVIKDLSTSNGLEYINKLISYFNDAMRVLQRRYAQRTAHVINPTLLIHIIT